MAYVLFDTPTDVFFALLPPLFGNWNIIHFCSSTGVTGIVIADISTPPITYILFDCVILNLDLIHCQGFNHH